MSRVHTSTILECETTDNKVLSFEGHLDCDGDFNSNDKICQYSVFIPSMENTNEGFWCTSTIDLAKYYRSVKYTKHKKQKE